MREQVHQTLVQSLSVIDRATKALLRGLLLLVSVTTGALDRLRHS